MKEAGPDQDKVIVAQLTGNGRSDTPRHTRDAAHPGSHQVDRSGTGHS